MQDVIKNIISELVQIRNSDTKLRSEDASAGSTCVRFFRTNLRTVKLIPKVESLKLYEKLNSVYIIAR